jgi:predicted RNase H-like HicB family nuclease
MRHVYNRNRTTMNTYTFNVVVEPDEDRWYAECPLLVRQGAATWGYTRDEALTHMEDVVMMVVKSLIEHGESIPEGSSNQVQVSTARVAVTV